MNTLLCYHCGKEVKLEHKVSFREQCSYCCQDLHICKNCQFYDESAYNECRESSAEPVREKERNNHCEYFVPSSPSAGVGGLSARSAQRAEHLQKAHALFAKNNGTKS